MRPCGMHKKGARSGPFLYRQTNTQSDEALLTADMLMDDCALIELMLLIDDMDIE